VTLQRCPARIDFFQASPRPRSFSFLFRIPRDGCAVFENESVWLYPDLGVTKWSRLVGIPSLMVHGCVPLLYSPPMDGCDVDPTSCLIRSEINHCSIWLLSDGSHWPTISIGEGERICPWFNDRPSSGAAPCQSTSAPRTCVFSPLLPPSPPAGQTRMLVVRADDMVVRRLAAFRVSMIWMSFSADWIHFWTYWWWVCLSPDKHQNPVCGVGWNQQL